MNTKSFFIPSLFILILITMIVFQNNVIGFGEGHHGYLSSHGLTLARNLSFGNNLFMFNSVSISEEGVKYQPYNRFSVLPFAIIKLAMLKYDSDLAMQVYISRQVMNVFFWFSMIAAYLLILKLCNNQFLALSVVLISFSSYYMQYYNDLIFNDVPALFGFLLLMLAIVTFETTGKRLFLYFAVFASLALGWQAFGVLTCWWLLKLTKILISKKQNITSKIRSIIYHPATISLAVGILWGTLILGFNLYNEWRVTGSAFSNLSTIGSIKFRTGLAGEATYHQYGEFLKWPNFIGLQINRLLIMSTPTQYLLDNYYVIVALLTIYISILLFFFFRVKQHRMLLMLLLLSGFLWSIPMKNFTAFHDFQSIFYIGVPLVIYYAIFLKLHRKAIPLILIITLSLFIFSNIDMNFSKAKASEEFNIYTMDFQEILSVVGKGNKIYIDGDKGAIAKGHHAVDFYLSGNCYSPLDVAEFIISENIYFNQKLLTPNNKMIFLFSPE